VDDIVVKTKKADQLVYNLGLTFDKLKKNDIKLNPKKCVFGVPKGMLLGFIVSEKGIKANPEKIAAIESMGPIHNIKGVQRVTGCLTVLSQFMSRLGERSLPLYKLPKKSERFTWRSKAQDALDQIKKLLTKTPILVSPNDGEELLLYIAAMTQVVSVALVVERAEEGHVLKVQRPMYFMSEVLGDSKTHYP
jgi:dsDNA-binding SOS-regulon protein